MNETAFKNIKKIVNSNEHHLQTLQLRRMERSHGTTSTGHTTGLYNNCKRELPRLISLYYRLIMVNINHKIKNIMTRHVNHWVLEGQEGLAPRPIHQVWRITKRTLTIKLNKWSRHSSIPLHLDQSHTITVTYTSIWFTFSPAIQFATCSVLRITNNLRIYSILEFSQS